MILIGNGRLLSLGTKDLLIENGCVAIEGSLIAEIGTTPALRQKYPHGQFVDALGGVIMPGFINSHHHIYSTLARGLAIRGYNPQGFLDILAGQWWRIDGSLTLADVYSSAMVTYLACIKAGVTTVFDHHASYGAIEDSLFTIETAAKELGVRTCLCYEVSDRGGQEKLVAGIQENADFIAYAQKENSAMIKGMMGLHASLTLTDQSLDLARASTPQDVGFHIHVAEDLSDEYDALRKFGKRVVHRLLDHDILGAKTIAGHCIHINGAEMAILKTTDTMVVHNPQSNMGNGVGCPPVLELLKKGILVGLGTDGYTNDMLESMKAASCLQKHHLCDSTVAWAEVPQLFLENNPKIGERCFEKKLGVLEAGALADVIVLKYDPPTPFCQENYKSHLLFGMTGGQVVTTVINGKLRMENRQLLAIDEAAIMAKAREQSQKLWQRINQ